MTRIASRNRLALVAMLVAAACAIMLMAGCSQEKAPSYDFEWGEASDSTTASVVENATEEAITSIAFEGQESFLAEGEAFEAGQVALINIPSNQGPTDLRFATAKGEYVLHGFDASAIEKAAIKIDGELAYLEIGEGDNAESTLAAEQEIKRLADEEAARIAAEEEAARIAAEEEAARIAAEEEAARIAEEEAAAAAAQEEYYYAPATGGSQSGDTCVEGGIAFR